jgi:hypothetical protein
VVLGIVWQELELCVSRLAGNEVKVAFKICYNGLDAHGKWCILKSILCSSSCAF